MGSITTPDPTDICNPGLCEKHACGNDITKCYHVASCMFHDTFKVKGSVSGGKTALSFIQNRSLLHWSLMYRGSSEIKYAVCGDKRIMLHHF